MEKFTCYALIATFVVCGTVGFSLNSLLLLNSPIGASSYIAAIGAICGLAAMLMTPGYAATPKSS